MSDERPVQFTVKKKIPASTGKVGIVHYSNICVSSAKIGNLSEHSFSQIRSAIAVHQLQSSEAACKSNICRNVPDQFNPDVHGVHWECYRNFTNVADLTVDVPTEAVRV